MKKKIIDLTESEKIKTLDVLYTAFGSVSGRETMKFFLRDLLTESERIMLGRRLLIAQLLISGATYEEITQKMGVGMDTIIKIHKRLKDHMPGFEKVINDFETIMQKRKGTHNPYSFSQLKKKYPLHFLLFNLADELNRKK